MSRPSTRLPLVTLCRTAWLLYVVGALVAPVRAQYQFDVWTTDNGLPQNSVNAILQTRDGYLWFATFDGLVRFDGVRFVVFNSANTKGVRSSRFTRLYEDRAGNLWLATENGGLTRYRGGVFRTYTTQDGLPSNYVRLMREEADGSLVMQTDAGFVRWKDEKFSRLQPEQAGLFPGFGHPLSPGIVWYLERDRWLRVFQGRVTREIPAEKVAVSDIKHAYEDQQSTFWVVVAPASLRRFKDGQWTAYTVGDPQTQGSIQAFREDRQGNIWIGTSVGALFRFRDGQFTSYALPAGVSGYRIAMIYQDRDGVLWLGTSNGLLRMREQIIRSYAEQEGLAGNNVYPIFEDRQGAIWIGSWSGLTKYEHGVFTIQHTPDGQPFGLVTALYEDREGNFWVALYGGNIWRYKDGQATLFTPQEGTLAKTGVHAIYQDRAGNLWFGSRNGLTRYKDGAATRYTTQDGLIGNEVKVIYEDRQGTLWVGTMTGLTRYRDGVFSAYREKDGITGSQVRALYEDSDGVLWVGTYDMGLIRWQQGQFTRYTSRDGLFSDGVFRILEDGRGYFWMSGNTGIYRVSKQELNDFAAGKSKTIISTPYGKLDGMRHAECNGGSQPAGIRARDGKLWFPTQGGVAVLDPAAALINPQPPPVVIEEFRLQREPVALGAGVRVLPGQGDFEIQYTALSFIKPEQVRFRYQLAGLDDEWREVGARRVAYFSHVPPGDYVFKVIAANSDGVWNMVGASLRVTVVPPFWQRWWFVALTVASCVGLLLLGYRRRVAQLERARAAQEAFSRQLIASEERERKRVAAELHDSLGQRLVLVKNLLLMQLRKPAANGAQSEQLNEISAEVSQAIAEVKEISYNLRPHQLDQLGLSKALKALIKRAGDSSGIAFSAEIEAMDGLLTPEAEISLYRIVQESINNIVKHAGATAARVTLLRDAAGVRLEIRDDGCGFSLTEGGGRKADAVDSIALLPAETLSPPTNPPSALRPPPSRGFGLIGIVERARLLGGQAHIHSAPGAGTTITVQMELRNGHPTPAN